MRRFLSGEGCVFLLDKGVKLATIENIATRRTKSKIFMAMEENEVDVGVC